MVRIEPVKRRDRRRALDLLASGAGPWAKQRASELAALMRGDDAGRCALWWARSTRGPQAAAVTIRNPGRVAMIYHASAGGRASGSGVSRLVRELSDATLAGGVAFVQASVASEAADAADALLGGGFWHLARLIHMQRDLDGLSAAGDDLALTWSSLRDDGDEEALGQVITATYAGSLDCPGLRGLRPVADVIATHKTSGTFRPDSWWIPKRDGRAVGCVLVNDALRPSDAAEVVYLGVCPPFRREGVARAMLRRAMADARRRGQREMTLAVDAANAPAAALYRQEGFRETERRDVYLRSAGTDAPPT